MKSLLSAGRFWIVWLALGMMVATSLSAATHDLTCYQILEPSSDYVEDGVPLIPVVGIASLGEGSEFDFPVVFTAVNNEGDTVFTDTVEVEYMGAYPDSIEVEISEWVPDGICAEQNPMVDYELTAIVSSQHDEIADNDTVRSDVQCLLSHDVGVTEIVLSPEPSELPDHYDVGCGITVTATVENFGHNAESDFAVRMEVIDCDSGGVLLWHNLQGISFLDWRDNDDDNPYIIDVVFPVFTIPVEHNMAIECRTELVDDNCPDNNEGIVYIHFCQDDHDAIGESGELPGEFNLKVNEYLWGSRGCTVGFALPRSSWVKLDVFDGCGRWTRSLANDIYQAGSHSLVWDLKDARGRKVSSGAYLVRMEAEEFSEIKKVVVLK